MRSRFVEPTLKQRVACYRNEAEAAYYWLETGVREAELFASTLSFKVYRPFEYQYLSFGVGRDTWNLSQIREWYVGVQEQEGIPAGSILWGRAFGTPGSHQNPLRFSANPCPYVPIEVQTALNGRVIARDSALPVPETDAGFLLGGRAPRTWP